MEAFSPEEILGALDDVGTEVVLDSGARISVRFRRDYREDDLPEAKIDSQRALLIVSESHVTVHGLRKGVALSVTGEGRFTIRRIEPMASGFARIVLTAV